MEGYEIGRTLAVGTFGQVSEGRRECDGLRVAVKRVRARKLMPHITYDPWSRSAEREIQVLSRVRHENVVRLLDFHVVEESGTTLLVYEYVTWDLSQILELGAAQDEGQVKAVVQMLLSGVAHLHSMYVMHRDLKPPNLLVDGFSGVLKIADFGSSRIGPGGLAGSPADLEGSMAEGASLADPQDGMTQDVCTRWYKSPEILFGSIDYTNSVDLWATGCILGELLTAGRKPLFPGGADIDQLCHIFRSLGTPRFSDWPEIEALPDFGKIEFLPQDPQPFEFESQWSELTIELLHSLLRLNPDRRISAAAALAAPLFSATPPWVAESRSLVADLDEALASRDAAADCSGLRDECDATDWDEAGFWGGELDGEGFERITFGESDVETTRCGLWDGVAIPDEPAAGIGDFRPLHGRRGQGGYGEDALGTCLDSSLPPLLSSAEGTCEAAAAASASPPRTQQSGLRTPPPPADGGPWRLKGAR